MDQDGHETETVAWRKYSYWELWIRPDLQSEYDAMLAERPAYHSKMFIVVMVLVLAVVVLGTVFGSVLDPKYIW